MSFSQISFPKETIKYITPTWDDMNDLAWQISQTMIKAGKKFDRIVTLAKGGWPMARSMVDFLEVKQVASIGVKFYCGINQRLSEPHIYQDLPEKIKGETILLFDDVADTGHSLQFTKEHLLKNGAKSVTTATLFYKPHSVFKPDYYAATTSTWIIFPYEKQETSKLLTTNWQQQGLSSTQIHSRLLRLGINH